MECQAKWAGPEARMVTGLRRNEWIVFLESDILRYGRHPDLRHAILIADLKLENQRVLRTQSHCSGPEAKFGCSVI